MIAIIGCSGLLGARVVERLAAKGHEVLAASRKERTDLPVGATPAVVDLRKPESIRAVLQDVDDVADLVVWAVEHRHTGRLKVVGPDNATPNEDIAVVAELLGAAPRVIRISPGFARFLSFIPGKLVPNIGRIIEISLHNDARDQPRKPADLPDGAPVPSRTLTEVVRDNLAEAGHGASRLGPGGG